MTKAPDDIYTPTLLPKRSSEPVLIITADDVHDLELFYPYYRLTEEGFTVDIASPKGGEIKGKAGYPCKNTIAVEDVNPNNYALLYIPGGKAPATLRKDKKVLELVTNFARTGKPIAAFCHGPQVLVDAGLLAGRKVTAYPEVEKEITEAGGYFVNAPLVEDRQFITARWPGDLPGFTKAVLEQLRSIANEHRAAS